MVIYPAIDLYGGKAVRLYKGDYAQMTVYRDSPAQAAEEFAAACATHIHLVDLEGAKTGKPENAGVIRDILARTDLFSQAGGGIRSRETIAAYLDLGVDRVILGTAAVTDPKFLESAAAQYGEKIALGVDLKDGFVAIKGWTETSSISAEAFFRRAVDLGIRTVICTDIARDGAMQGTNRELYRDLSQKFPLDIIASGGVSSLEDIKALRGLGLHGAIIGKAYYQGAIDLKEAVEAAK